MGLLDWRAVCTRVFNRTVGAKICFAASDIEQWRGGTISVRTWSRACVRERLRESDSERQKDSHRE